MDNQAEFVSYKKVLVFGTLGVGKTSLTKSIEKGIFTNESHTENGNPIIYLII